MAYLNKEKLIEELNKTPMIAQHIDCMDLFDAINNSIAENVTEIVRCKDCKHYRINTVYPGTNMIMKYCAKTGIAESKPDWFCADGELKEEVDK